MRNKEEKTKVRDGKRKGKEGGRRVTSSFILFKAKMKRRRGFLFSRSEGRAVDAGRKKEKKKKKMPPRQSVAVETGKGGNKDGHSSLSGQGDVHAGAWGKEKGKKERINFGGKEYQGKGDGAN